MRKKKTKYDEFSEIFIQLPDKSQDKLVQIAHRLLKTQQIAKGKNAGEKKNITKGNPYST